MVKSAWMLVVNPKAGIGRGLKDWPIICGLLNRYNVEFTCMFTEHKYHAVELTVKAIKNGYRNIVAVGGDGTIHEVVNGIFFQECVPTTEINLAVIPTGSGNDWIKMYGISKTYSDAIKAMIHCNTMLQDIGRISFVEARVPQVRYLANTSGLGFDASVCYQCNDMKERGRNGKWVYLRSALKSLIGHRPKLYKIEVDGHSFYEGLVYSVAIAIGKYSGSGMQQTPHAATDDGLVDLTVIKKISRMRIIREMKKLYSGEIYSIPEVIYTQAKKIVIKCIPDERIEIDGEVVGITPYVFEILPKSINVVVGEDKPL